MHSKSIPDMAFAVTEPAEPRVGPEKKPQVASPVRSAVLPRARSENAAAPDAPSPRYRFVRVLASGGMGEVALAEDVDIGREVAIKRVLERAAEGDGLLRFAEEVRALGMLDHPGIVPIHDVGIGEDGHVFAVMKYIKGETLEEIISSLKSGSPEHRARFTHDYRARIFASILEAIDFAHRRGFVHRDIKPSNIMVGRDGEVTVMDWGIARLISSSGGDRLVTTQEGTLIGTPLYMSPEQARGDNEVVDARSDVFSLSLLFWELMSLEHPFAGRKTMFALLAAIITEQISANAIALSRIRTHTPCEYGWFALKGLGNKPEDRFPSVAAMLAEFRQVQAGRFPVQCDVTLTKRALHEFDFWLDRHGWLSRLLFLGVAAAVIYAVLRAI